MTPRPTLERLDREARERDAWKKRNSYYHRHIERLCRSIVSGGSSVLEIGCSTGDLLASLNPARGVGMDVSATAVRLASEKYPALRFEVHNAEELPTQGPYDYVVMSDVVGYLNDVWAAFRNLRRVTGPSTRVVITYYNALWEPFLQLAQALGLKSPQSLQNWLSMSDLEGQLRVNGYEVVRRERRLLLPLHVPLLSNFVNRFIAPLPFIRKFCLVQCLVARESPSISSIPAVLPSCSVVVPCRNEAGNIERLVAEVPMMGRETEIIFVDGDSTDGTINAIEAQIAAHGGRRKISLIRQDGARGKGDAVRKGFAAATGDVLFILDADLTVPPEDLPKFFQAIVENHGEFINGTRLVYPMEKEAMRWLNLVGNRFFSLVFSWLLEQKIKDTLCGTKVLTRKNYERLAANRAFFGEFDPFGDFDLLFGAAKLSLKIIDIPVRYRMRTYGSTKIDRFRHGWLLLRMCGVAMKKLKFAPV
jgi:SAM-dependent methyltransferase